MNFNPKCQGSKMDYDSLLELVKNRRSIRKFKTDPVSDEHIDKILEVARQAPSGLNSQPWEFIVITDPAMLDTLGWVYFRMGEYQKALVPLEQALDLAPEADIILYHMGMLLHKTGRLQEAREKLRKALAGEADFIGRQEAEKVLRSLT